MKGIDHPYWTSRKGNAVRFAMWHRRRSHAAPFLREIAKRHGEGLTAAAAEFEKETALLAELLTFLGPQADEAAHWVPANVARAAKLVEAAGRHHEAGMAAIRKAIASPLLDSLDALAKMDADALQKEVAGPNALVAEAALARLVALAPKDLDARLAALWTSLPEARKDLADGPIHRQILFALSHLDTPAATEAIGRAVFFAGKGDDVPHAVARWAAEMYWKRRGAEGRDVWLKAMDSEVPHVADLGVRYVGKTGDKSLLPKLKGRKGASASFARALLGDEAGWEELFAALAEPEWVPAAKLLIEAGAPAEPRVIARLKDPNPQVLTACAIVLSRMGSAAALEPLKATVDAHPEIPRIKQAYDDLQKRLAK